MIATFPQHIAGVRPAVVRAIVVALSITLFLGPADAGALSLSAAHAPGGVIHVAISQADSSQIVTVSRSVGLMRGAGGTAGQSELGASPAAARSAGPTEGEHS